MKTNESEQISWINGQPIPKGEPSDSALVGWMIFVFVLCGLFFFMFRGEGDRHD